MGRNSKPKPPIKRTRSKSYRKLRKEHSNRTKILAFKSKKCNTSDKPSDKHIQHETYRETTYNLTDQIIPNKFKSNIAWCESCNSDYNLACHLMAQFLFNNQIAIKAINNNNSSKNPLQKESFNIKNIKELKAYCSSY